MSAAVETTPHAVHRPITSTALKACVYGLEGANSFATTYFFYYIYFYTHDHFGFHDLPNFLLAAAMGLVYAAGSIYGGRFAQKTGYFSALRVGIVVMIVALIFDSQVSSVALFVGGMFVANFGQCFCWPALEGMLSEGESRSRLRGLVGMYNVTWAVASATAFFVGGALQTALGHQSIFFFPIAFFVVELIFSFWLEKKILAQPQTAAANKRPEIEPPHEWAVSPVPPRTFLNMALLANPFAYVAINTILPTLPSLALRFDLSKALAGVFCSLWLFARAAAFVFLWYRPRWHYRFRYLAGAFITMIICFAAMLLAPALSVLLIAQAVLGVGLGLIYYSSLFYSMDVGETKGEHAGIHEAAIGAGGCAGPVMAAVALHFFPSQHASGTVAVTVLLCAGLAGLFWLRYRKQQA